MARSSDSSERCSSVMGRKISVLAAQRTTARLHLLSAMKRRMSPRRCSIISRRVAPCSVCVPCSRLAQRGSKAAAIGRMVASSSATPFRSFSLSTSAHRAASRALSGKMSHPPKTRLSSSAMGTISLISCSRPSCLRIRPICVTDPIGLASPRRAAITPAIIVVDTAPPTPAIRTAKRPSAAFNSCFILSIVCLPLMSYLHKRQNRDEGSRFHSALVLLLQ